MRLSPLSLLLLAAVFAAQACSSDTERPDAGPGGNGTDTGTSTQADAGPADTGAPDSGPPPCVRDQDCDSGMVCNLPTQQCVAGTACTGQADCDRCSALNGATDCGHGYELVAYCDPGHGNVCVRALAPCEPCEDDTDCGELHAQIRSAADPSKCLEYEGGQKFCGRDATFGCPIGFIRDATTDQCVRPGGCSADTVICPEKPAGQQCPSGQTCPGELCEGTGGARCTNNDLPGSIGICIGACQADTDCTDPAFPVCNSRNGICIAGCTQGSCAGGKVCHSDGFCADPCADDDFCAMRYGDPNYYCNTRGRPSPRQYKNYRDENSCAPLGCEQAIDCPAAGLVCDKSLAPPDCVVGCFTTEDCLAGEVCKDPGPAGPQPSYNRQQCRALGAKADDTSLGVCCNPGCTDRILQCDLNQWCCAEEDSPFEDPNTCGTITGTVGPTRQAEPGECFDIAPKPTSPFCEICGGMDDPPCSSDDYNGGGANWTAGYNVDPMINGGQPFKEQEFCFGVAQNLGMCSVSCNPLAPDNGCPRGWTCGPFFPPCLQDADCGTQGLTCEGEDTSVDPPRTGRCLCGENGVQNVQCGTAYAQLQEAVNNPRCVEQGANGQMFCVATYHCAPPPIQENPPMSGNFNYPDACLP